MRWALHEHLRGQMPSLPSTRSTLRDSLVRHPGYVDLLIDVSDRLGAWIDEAQRRKAMAPRLPPEVILYTLFARACDPVSDYLKLSGNSRTTRSWIWSRRRASTDWPPAETDRSRRHRIAS